MAILALSALAIGKWMGIPTAVAALVGNLLGVLNLLGLAWLVGKLLGTAERGGSSKGVYAAILAFKLAAFVGVMALCIKVFELDILGMLFGFSSLVLALVVGSLYSALTLPAADSDESNDGGPAASAQTGQNATADVRGSRA
ncbi:MAG: hypothetical protein IV100_17395 [Myxococcales bacterium]|nr:hypothetical protein [Myxococcales bacterium]